MLPIGETWQAVKEIQRDTAWEGVEAEARKATRRKLSLSVSFPRFEEHATRKKSDAAAAACDVYTRIARIHFSPSPLPSFFFLLLLLLLFSLRFLRLSVRHSSGSGSPVPLARSRGSFHPRLRTLALNDALRVFKQKFHFVGTAISESLSGGGVFSPCGVWQEHDEGIGKRKREAKNRLKRRGVLASTSRRRGKG